VAISADGRYVAFETDATNLIGAGNDNNGVSDIFRWDRTQPLATAISRISVTDIEVKANGASDHVTLSSDGNKVLFASIATNLIGAVSATGQIFLRDITGGTTVQVSLLPGGGPASTPSYGPRLSGDGNTAAFWATLNSNLAPSRIGTDRVLRRDLTTGAYDSVLDVGGQPIATAPNRYANLSSDGRYLALVTNTQIDPIDSEGGFDLYVYDFDTGTGRAVRAPNGSVPQDIGGAMQAVALSGDGQVLTTDSTATNLVTADTNGVADLFLFENPAFALALEQEVETLVPTANDSRVASHARR